MEKKNLIIMVQSIFIAIIIICFIISKITVSADKKEAENKNFNEKLEKCVENLNFTMEKSKDIFLECKTQYEFARLWVFGMKVAKVENMVIPETTTVSYSERELQDYNIPKEYYFKPAVHTLDKSAFYLLKFEPKCPKVDLENPYESSCIITIDVNGLKKPNKKDTDRFDYIFDGPNYKIISVKELLENAEKTTEQKEEVQTEPKKEEVEEPNNEKTEEIKKSEAEKPQEEEVKEIKKENILTKEMEEEIRKIVREELKNTKAESDTASENVN